MRGRQIRPACCLVAAALAVVCGTASNRSRADIILVTIDTLRADRLHRGLTPALDRLAAGGIEFTRAYTVAPLTLPAHTSMMTGLLPPVHGVRDNGVAFRGEHPTVAGILRQAGYRTSAFVGAYVLNRRFGLDAGFDTYDDETPRSGPVDRLGMSRTADKVVDSVWRWAGRQARDGAAPWFLWVHLYDPHKDYIPPPAYLSRAGSPYDGEVAFTDSHVQRLLDILSLARPARDRIVVVVSDHGESLGEHGENTHGVLLYDATIRVPLILSGPGLTPRRSDEPVSVRDVARTLIALAGLPPVDRMEGRDLVKPFDPAPAYSESVYPRAFGGSTLLRLTDARWTLVLSPEAALFDARGDSRGEKNLAPREPGAVRALSARLRGLESSGPAELRQSVNSRELQALGYVSGGRASAGDRPTRGIAEVLAIWSQYERFYERIDFLLNDGKTEAARRLVRDLGAAAPDVALFRETEVQTLNAIGDHREAVRRGRDAIAAFPDDAILHFEVGVAEEALGNPGRALEAYRLATTLDDHYAPAFQRLGRLLVAAARIDEGRAALERAVRLEPERPGLRDELARAQQVK